MSDTPNTPPDDSEGVRALRARADAADAAEARAALAERRLAFAEAGIDTTSKPAQALVAAYDGELTKEAIQAEAKEWGLVREEQPPAPPPDPITDPASPESQYAATQGALGGGAPAPPPGAPAKTAAENAMDRFAENRKKGMRTADAEAMLFDDMVASAKAGDPTAIFDEQAWMKHAEAIGHGAR